MRDYLHPGGWYGDSLPTGEWVSLVGRSHIDTWQGRVELPETGPDVLGPRYLRMSISPRYGFQMAGQADKSVGTWLYRFGKWTLDPRVSHGESAHIFDLDGELHIITPAPNQTSQGFRYITEDGQLVLGDNAILADDVSQPSTFGTIIIGQSRAKYEGVVIHNGADRRQPYLGSATFIRVRKAATAWSIATVVTGGTQFFWFTTPEISSFQPEVPYSAPAPTPVPTPTPTPPAPPAPTPEPKPMSFPVPQAVKAIVQALYERNVNLAEGTDDDRRALILKIAQQCAYELGPTWGAKDAGGGRPMSKDAIAHVEGATLYVADCFNGSTRKPAVPDTMDDATGQHFIEVTPVNYLGQAPSNPPGTKPGPAPASTAPGASLDVQIARLQRQVTGLLATVAGQAKQIAALERRPQGSTGTGLANGATVALKSQDNGEYLTVEPNGDVNAKGPRSFGTYQLFTIEEK